MNKPILIYCYDAYCGWCFGFSKVMQAVNKNFHNQLQIDVLSGGMVTPEKPVHVSATAEYILGAYPRVEELTGVQFGEDYLWHLKNADKSDWYPNSTKPAVALCIVKELQPEQQVAFAADLQHSLYVEGRDLTDDEAYRHLIEKYTMDVADFYCKLKSEAYIEKAKYEFQLCKQLQVNGFPAVLIQTTDSKFYAVAKGYTNYDTLAARINQVLAITTA
jgi:putative protein-disulfide isomerase